MSKKIKTILGSDGYDYPYTHIQLISDSKNNSLESIISDLKNKNNNFENSLNYKISKPVTDGTAGQVLSLNSDGTTQWLTVTIPDNTKQLTTTTVSNNTLTLTTNEFQKTNITSDTTIVLPTVTSFSEIHLFFKL